MKAAPFTNWKEWRYVYSLLFKQIKASTFEQFVDQFKINDSMAIASHLFSIWELKGRVPLLITVTQQMLDGLININAKVNSKYTLALCISRSISHIADHFRISRKKSIASICDEIGMPPLLIDIRHTVTHREIPNYDTLSICAKMLIFWCYKKYWVIQNIKISNERKAHRALISSILYKQDLIKIPEKISVSMPVLYSICECLIKSLEVDLECRVDEESYEKLKEGYLERNEITKMRLKSSPKLKCKEWYKAFIARMCSLNGGCYLVCVTLKRFVGHILNNIDVIENTKAVNCIFAYKLLLKWIPNIMKQVKNSEAFEYHLRMVFCMKCITPLCKVILKTIDSALLKKISSSAYSIYKQQSMQNVNS